MNSYIVAYKHGARYGKIYVEANDKTQAAEIARIQIQSSWNSRSRFTALKVLLEGEKDPDDEEVKQYLVKKA